MTSLYETAKQYLDNGAVVRLVFTKKDGTERVLVGTRNITMIPSDHHPKGSEQSRKSDTLPVYDLEAQGWRSFKPDSLKAVEVHPPA
jgi:hypothetical protein